MPVDLVFQRIQTGYSVDDIVVEDLCAKLGWGGFAEGLSKDRSWCALIFR